MVSISGRPSSHRRPEEVDRAGWQLERRLAPLHRFLPPSKTSASVGWRGSRRATLMPRSRSILRKLFVCRTNASWSTEQVKLASDNCSTLTASMAALRTCKRLVASSWSCRLAPRQSRRDVLKSPGGATAAVYASGQVEEVIVSLGAVVGDGLATWTPSICKLASTLPLLQGSWCIHCAGFDRE